MSKVADTDKTTNSQDPIERAGKLLPLVLAALYLTGFMVVALHLAGYGASSLDLFKIQYLAAGIWFGFVLILFFGIDILLRVFLGSFFDGLSPKGGFLRFSNYETLKDGFATTVISLLWFAGLLIVIVLAGKRKPGGGVIPFLYDCRYLLLSLVGLDIFVRLLLIFRKKQRRSSETDDEINERLSRVPGAVFAEWGFNYLKVLMALTSVGIFFESARVCLPLRFTQEFGFRWGAVRLVRWCFGWIRLQAPLLIQCLSETVQIPNIRSHMNCYWKTKIRLWLSPRKAVRRQSYLTERPSVRSYC